MLHFFTAFSIKVKEGQVHISVRLCFSIFSLARPDNLGLEVSVPVDQGELLGDVVEDLHNVPGQGLRPSHNHAKVSSTQGKSGTCFLSVLIQYLSTAEKHREPQLSLKEQSAQQFPVSFYLGNKREDIAHYPYYLREGILGGDDQVLGELSPFFNQPNSLLINHMTFGQLLWDFLKNYPFPVF